MMWQFIFNPTSVGSMSLVMEELLNKIEVLELKLAFSYVRRNDLHGKKQL